MGTGWLPRGAALPDPALGVPTAGRTEALRERSLLAALAGRWAHKFCSIDDCWHLDPALFTETTSYFPISSSVFLSS